jgi:hypothetical protein
MFRKSSNTYDFFPDENICYCTGKPWSEWCAIIDLWRGDKNHYAPIAHYLTEQYRIRRLWAQAIAVYYRSRQVSQT